MATLNRTRAASLETRIAQYRQGTLSPRQQERLKRDVIRAYQPYVEKITRGLARRQTDPVEDLIQVGCLGVLKALEKFDPTLNVHFKTYCTYHITGEIRHYLRDKVDTIKPPRALKELYYRMNQLITQLSQQLGRSPTDLELAEALQCPPDQLQQARLVERRQQTLSLEAFERSDAQGRLYYPEHLVDERSEDALSQLDTRLSLEQGLGQLSEPLRQVVQLYYYEDLSQHQIASQLGISQMQVSRRLRRALGSLAQSLSGQTVGKRRSLAYHC